VKPFSIWVLVFMLACGGLSRLFAGELEVYFGPTKAKDAAGLHTQTIKVIDSAKKTLDGAIHELRLQSIVDALVAAKQRGVEVRVICDDAYYENEFMKQLRAAKIPTKHDGNTKAIMHDKFVVADGERMVTGSYNLTDTCSFNNHNNLLVISNRDVSQIYAAEFEKLWAGHFYDSEDGAIQHAVMQVDGRKVPVDILFQPRYKDTKDKVVELLSSAQKSLYMAQFAFFSAKVANLMSAKLEAGVDVRAVIDYSMVYGELEPLNQIGELAEKRIPFCIGDDPNGKMHHKFFVVDPDSSSAMVLTGSANASSSGYDSNVENIIVVHDQKVAKQYKDEVLHLLNRRATGTVTIPRKGINGVGKVQTFDINIESGGEALKQLEITLPYFWRVQSAETVTATRGDAATPVSLRLEERSPSRESKVKVQILMADAANLTADGPDSKLSLHLGAVNLDPKTHTGRYCIYVRGSDASGKLQVIPNLPILWLFRSAAESIAEADRLLSAKDDRSAKDLEYLLRDLSSNLYQEIDTGKLSAMKDFVALVEKTAQDKNPRFKMVSNTARLVCQRLVAAYGVDANSGEEGAALAARLKTTLTSGGVELKPPKEVHVEAPPATAEGFKADLVEALHRYHNTDGKGNGGSVSGLQLPPGVKDLPALEK
jgi:phosphatidylserine/phosphatidylglycerophosphate/cardiolipin synthase-like enzyme